MGASGVLESLPAVRAGAPHGRSIVVGVTHAQTCLVLGARVRALRQAGFRVTLMAGPGTLLDRTAAAEGVERIAIPMRRGIAPLADLIALGRLWRLLGALKPDIVEFSTPKAGLLGALAAMLCGVPASRLHAARSQAGNRVGPQAPHPAGGGAGGRRLRACRALQQREPAPNRHWLSTWLRPANFASWAMAAATASIRSVFRRVRKIRGRGSASILDAPVIGFVGRLTRDKGLPELIEAFESIALAEPRARLLLVGWFDASEDALSVALRVRILTHPQDLLHRICRRHGALLSRHGFAGSAHLARRLPQRGFGSRGYRHSRRDHAVHGLTRLRRCLKSPACSFRPDIRRPSARRFSSCFAIPIAASTWASAARAWVFERFVDERVLGLTAAWYRSLLDCLARRRGAKRFPR